MRGARILVVEDDAPTVEVVKRYLAMKGHSVLGAGSAEEGAAALRAGSFDGVLLDVVLPGRSGLQALSEYRRLTSAPIIVMSGDGGDEARKDALLLGAAGFLPKPLDLAAAAAIIAALPDRAP